ncbi:MAG: SGNH/GDSL hydrolase family protein [Gemmatimonadales bacterium]
MRTGLSLVGFGALAVSLAVELLGIGTAGLGVQQFALAFVGFGALLARDWLTTTSASRTGDLARYATIAFELAALTVVLTVWQLEGPGLYERIAPLIFLGFLIHHALPAAWRPGFFLALSLAGILAVLGMANGLLVVGVGLLLIAICHLPVSFGARALLLVAAGVVLALARYNALPVRLPLVVWPVLSSIFMFRLAVYFYDLRHGNAPPGVFQRLSYFFMLPNVIFPLFPVVDSSIYHRRYYDVASPVLYQRGIDWILRGALHLLAYRFIYQRLTLAPADVADTLDLAQYMATTFGLYLRVSGQFHLIVGILHLFGHRLPETHQSYFLSSSFTDFWRRINIYWKDFIQKLVYYPVYFRLRKRGEVTGLVVATLVAFFVTWLLHSYQWFWILGEPLFSAPDTLFWSVLALLVLANVLIERKRGRIRKLASRGFSVREAFSLGIRTAATMLILTALWSIWTSGSTEEWVALFSAAEWRTGRFWLLLGGVFAGGVVVAGLVRLVQSRGPRLGDDDPRHFSRQAAIAFALIGGLLFTSAPIFTDRVPLETQVALRDLRSGELNARDAERMQRGYYENLIGVNALNSQLWEVYAQRPDDWQFILETPAGRETGDFLEKELVPGAAIVWHGAPLRINEQGFRDREYPVEPPAGTKRVVMFGASYAFGSGVGNGENFESLVEDRLNAERGAADPAIEVLNFAVPGFTAVQSLRLLETKVADYRPDVLWLVSYNEELLDVGIHIVKMVRAGVPLPYPFLDEVVRRAGVTADLTEPEAKRRLQPYHGEIMAWVYERIIEVCRERGIFPVWVYLPASRITEASESFERAMPAARDAGFAIVDLSMVYDGPPLEEIIVAPYDFHPNQRGHQIIADELYRALAARPELYRGPDSTATGNAPAPATAPGVSP